MIRDDLTNREDFCDQCKEKMTTFGILPWYAELFHCHHPGSSLYQFVDNIHTNHSSRPSVSSDDFEFIEVIINGEQMPSGNFSEILLPSRDASCFSLCGKIWGKDVVIHTMGNIKIVCVPKDQVYGPKEKEVKNES